MNENQLKDTTIGTASLPLAQVLSSGFVGMLLYRFTNTDVNLPVSTAVRQCGFLHIVASNGGILSSYL